MKKRKVHIDFETRSKCDIWKSGAWVYSKDPSTEILCIAFAIDEGEVEIITWEEILAAQHFIWGGCADHEEDLVENFRIKARLLYGNDPFLKDTILVAHNAFFEQSIWNNILTPILGFPPTTPEHWVCSMAKASAFGVPRALDRAAKALRLPIEKDLEGKRIMMKLAKPRKPTKHNPAIWHENPEDFEKLYKYCIDDVRVEREIDRALPNLNHVERKLWLLDQKINMRGVQVDLVLVKSALAIIARYTDILNARLSQLTNGYVDRVTRTERVKYWLRSQGVVVEDLQKATVDKLLSDTHFISDAVKEVLRIRQQLSKSSTKKYETMLKSADPKDSRIRDTLLYHGASTGRWTGKLVQVQNLPRGIIKDTDQAAEIVRTGDLELLEMLYSNVMGTLSSTIRSCLVAKPDHKLIAVDYNAIETRVLFWLSGDKLGLSQFRNDEDLYSRMAEVIYGGSGYSKETHSKERQLGKQAILGCGYGMGAGKFAMTCNGYNMDVSDALAKRAVKAYRDTYATVPALWKRQEKAVIEALETKKIVICDGIKWGLDGNFLLAILPSGRHIAYHYPDLKWEENRWGTMQKQISYMSVDSTTNSYLRTGTWGGKIVENLVQGIARDILAEAMLRLDNQGFEIVLTVHDEIVIEVHKAIPSYVGRVMCELPVWAKGLPLATEGWKGKRYKK